MTIAALLCMALGAGQPARAQSEETVELHVWGMNLGEPRVAWYAVMDAFERRYPHVRIVPGPTDRGEDLQKLLSGYVGNAPPDVFRRESGLFGDIASRGILMPLDAFLDADEHRPDGLRREDFAPGALESGSYEGTIYAIPDALNPLVLTYNREMFREAGLDPDRPPATWDEWIACAERLTEIDARGRVQRLGLIFHIQDDLVFYMRQLGAPIFSPDGRQVLLDSAQALEAAEFLARMFGAVGGFSAVEQFKQALSSDIAWPLGTERVAMAVEDDWALYRGMWFNPEVDLGVAPVPAPPGRPYITTSGTNTLYMIPDNARQPEAAWDFIRFIISPEGQTVYFRAWVEEMRRRGRDVLYPGIRANLKTAAVVSDLYGPQEPMYREGYERMFEILESLEPEIASPVSAVMRDEVRRAVQRITLDNVRPANALRDSSRRVQEQLDLYHLRNELPLLRWWIVWLILAVGLGAAVYLWKRALNAQGPARAMQRIEDRMGLVFISPWLFGFLTLVAGPMVFSVAISFADYNVIEPARYVGLRNYYMLLTRDPLFWKSLWNTTFMVLALPLGMAFSLAIALLLNTNVRGMSFYRTVFYLPAITPAIAAAVLWYALLNPDGLVNAGLHATLGNWFGLNPPAWLADPRWSKPAIVLMGLWGAGGGMILWLAGLQGIPQQLYEAADIDGAGRLQRFFYVTLPMLTPYIFFNLVVGIIGVFQIFAQALVLTAGGPADSTLFYVFYLFNNAFRYFKMGYASAQAWILFVLVLILTLVQWRLARKWVHYG